MGFFSKIFKPEPSVPHVETVAGGLYAPITGQYIPLEQLPDEVFSQGVLGAGCGIEPEEGLVVSPVKGTVIQIADTKHAIGIASSDGAELRIHVGMDTVAMNGNGFDLKVQMGAKVSCGQPLLTFDMGKIRAAGHPATTAFVITNSDEFPNLLMDVGKRYHITEKIGQIG